MTGPSPNGADGRDGRGRFAKGNAGGPGSPHAAQTARLRAVLLSTVTEEDMRAVIAKLVEKAKGGDLPAIRELLLRVLGKPIEADLIERLDQLEAALPPDHRWT